MFRVSTPADAFPLRNLYGDSYGDSLSVLANVIFYHLQVKFTTLQEQHANSMRALMSDTNKPCEPS